MQGCEPVRRGVPKTERQLTLLVKLSAAEHPAVFDFRLDVVTVHEGNPVDGDGLGASLLALTMIGARAEVLLHRFHHGFGALVPLGLALWEQIEVGDLG